jgi:molecular chaperone Hsp33
LPDVNDCLVRAIDPAAGLRIIAAVTTELSREAARRHGAVGIGACALGRGLTSGLLLATLTKGEERVTVQLQSDGPLGGITVDATLDPHSAGQVRGYLVHPRAATAPCNSRGHVVEVLGRSGVVNVTRDIGLKDRYQGQVPLLTGEVDEDVESYLRISEQVPSALGCDVLLSDGLAIEAAGGVLVQSLPGAGNEHVWEAQHAVRTGAVYRFLADGGREARALAEAVYGKALEFIGEQPLRFQCRCSADRVRDMLRLLSVVDIDEIIAEHGHAEVTCNYCSARYVVDQPDLEVVRAELAGGPRRTN